MTFTEIMRLVTKRPVVDHRPKTHHNTCPKGERCACYITGYNDDRGKMSQHHPSCTPSDRDLVWLCAQCGGHEYANEVLTLLTDIYALMPDATMKDLKDRITKILEQ